MKGDNAHLKAKDMFLLTDLFDEHLIGTPAVLIQLQLQLLESQCPSLALKA